MELDVLILCSGEGRYFPATLDSVLRQTEIPAAIYVLDNACPHDSYRVMAAAASSPLVRYQRFPERKRLTANWQRCLDVGSSPFFVCLHDDDLWDEDVIARVSAGFARRPETTAYLLGHSPFHDGQPDVDQQAKMVRREEDLTFVGGLDEPLRSFVLSTANLGHMCALFCRRSAIGYPIQNTYMPDQGFLANHTAYGSICVDPKVGVHIREHAQSATSSYQGNSRSSVELITQIRNILLFQIENRGFQAKQLAGIADHVPRAYLYRILQACHSWPLRKPLLNFGRDLLMFRPFRGREGSKAEVRNFLGVTGWVMASLLADLAYFQREKALPN